MNEDGTRTPPRRPDGQEYVRPKVVQSEKIVSRATACAKHNGIDCPGGPITS